MAINIPGFVPATNAKPYLKLCLEGWHRSGRTHFGLKGAPGPVAVVCLDGNTEHVAQKMIEQYGREILINKEFMGKFQYSAATADMEQKAKWEKFKDLYFNKLLPHPDLKSIIIDTGSDLWEMTRAAEYGKMEKVPQFAYGAANHPWRQMVNLCEKNLIVTHKLQNYGVKIDRKGMEEVAYLCHAVIRTTRLPRGMAVSDDPDGEATARGIPVGYWDALPGEGEFALRIMDSTHNPALAGKILVGSECTFKQVAMLMFPNTSSKDWK